MAESLGSWKRSKYCAEVLPSDCGQQITLMGWIQRRRDLGSLIFLWLRDRSGIMQVVFDQSKNAALFEKAQTLNWEYCIAVVGTVAARTPENVNPSLKTGTIELIATELKILSESEIPPFAIEDDVNVNDALRLKYRYLDLRRPTIQSALFLRHRIASASRRYFDDNGFIEVETPMLTKSTPEGARDYLVPSRVHPGNFYALPQSPQQFKQILMVSGFDRYYQIVKCFRDEDLRADRQPEFTQIDIEMSFVQPEDVMTVTEGMLADTFRQILGVEIPLPVRRMTYREAMERYGSDKPDLRFGMEIQDISDVVRDSEFTVFSSALAAGGSVRAVKASGMASLTRKEIDALTEHVKTYRAKGLAWLTVGPELRSSFAKFLTPETIAALTAKLEANDGDMIFVVADASTKTVLESLGQLRLELARRSGLLDPNRYEMLWVTEFPLLEYDEEEKRYVAMHHPFTSPMDEDIELMDSNPGAVRAKAYDIVINGMEIGGGSVRIHDSELQSKMFTLLGFSEERKWAQFGFLLEAFKYGAPPHGGLALGLDRLVMLMAGKDSIRDVIAFPKLQNASCLMSDAPSDVDPIQLKELHIKLDT